MKRRVLFLIVPAVLALTPVPAHAAKPAPHRLVLSEQHNGQLDLWAVNDDGTAPRRLTKGRRDDQHPAVSPDGRRIAFARGVAFDSVPAASDLWIMDADGKNQRKLVAGLAGAEYRPSFSPDGRRVLFTGHFGYAAQSIWVATLDGRTPPKKIVDNATYAHWGPDGRIVYVSDPVNGGPIIVADADGSHPRTLVKANGVSPQWSPDGKRIVYTSFANGPGKVFVINADGTGNRQVERDPLKTAGFATWSPDGTRIAFSSTRDMTCAASELRDCPRRVFTINADGTGLRQLRTGSDLDQYPTYVT